MLIRQALSTFWVFILLVGVSPAQEFAVEPQWPLVSPVDDPALMHLVVQTLQVHPQVLAAQAAVDASEALEQAAGRPVYNPELELAIDRSKSNQRTLGVNQTIDWAGQRGARTTVASREHQMALAELASIRRNLANELLASLAEYWVADGIDSLARKRLELMQHFVDLALQRQSAGDLTQADLTAARLGLAQARIEQANTAGDLAEADQALHTLIPAWTSEKWPRMPSQLPEVKLEQLDVAQALAALPAVRAQQATIAAAEARVNLRQRERRPNPTIGLQAGQEEGDSLIGLHLTIPLYVRNRFNHEVVAAQAVQRQTESEAANVESRARGRLLATTLRYRLTREAWNSWLANGELNLTQQISLLEHLWSAGDLSLTDYLVQLNQTFDTERSALELERKLWLAWIDWLSGTAQMGAWLDVPVECAARCVAKNGK